MILVAGEALVDVFPDGSARPGGSPFNVAVGLARLGCPVALAAGIADDAWGRLLRLSLEGEGVATGFLRASPPPTPSARVEVGADGSATYRFAGLDGLEFPVGLPLDPGVTCVHAGSYALVSRSARALLDLFESAPAGVLRSVDPNVRLAMEPDLERWRCAVDAFAGRADLLKASEEDVRALAGDGADVEKVASGWLAGRCSLVALTRGARGATLFSRRHGTVDAGPFEVEVADTVGAGDSFQSALLAGLCRAGSVPDDMPRERLRSVLETAVRAGALACARPGADPPTLARLAPQWG